MFSVSALGPVLRPGVQTYVNAALPTGNTDIVTAAANTTGLIVRTCYLVGPAGGNLYLQDGINAIFVVAAPSQQVVYQGAGILVPPGSALRLTGGAANGIANVTWDIL